MKFIYFTAVAAIFVFGTTKGNPAPNSDNCGSSCGSSPVVVQPAVQQAIVQPAVQQAIVQPAVQQAIVQPAPAVVYPNTVAYPAASQITVNQQQASTGGSCTGSDGSGCNTGTSAGTGGLVGGLFTVLGVNTNAQ